MAAGGRSSLVVALVVLLAMAVVSAGAAAEVWPPPPHAVVAKNRPGDCRGVVDAHCHGTIGEALKDEAGPRVTGAKAKGRARLVILITAGVYEEQVNITRRNVVLLGEGRGNTIISGNLSNLTGTEMYMTATVNALGHGFLAQNLTIRNVAGPRGKQAVALRSNSNRSVVFGCSIEGYEDSLYAENGAQLYLDTDIYGTVDFIFGNAMAVFQRCRIRVREPIRGNNKHNVVTAQGCNNKTYENSGFVFHRCIVEEDPNPSPAGGGAPQNLTGVDTFLGRPHRNFSHVLFMQSELGAVVHAEGWVPWDRNHVVKETTESVRYMEFNNTGPGADTTKRVRWTGVQVLHRADEVAKYTIDNFIAGKEWIPQQIPYDHEVPRGVGVGVGVVVN